MPSTKKRYRFSYNGKLYNVFANSDREAGRLIAEKKQQLEENSALRSGALTLKAWAPECIEAYKTRQSKRTRSDFEYLVDHAILSQIGDLQLKEITPIDCQKVINRCSGKSSSWINAVYQALRFLFSKAVINNLIKKDPTEGLERPKGTRGHRRALTPEERNSLLRAAPSRRSWWVYLLMVLCGCRPSEAANCKRSDISEVIDRSGRIRHLLHIRGTKTAQADRYVPLTARLWDLVQDLPADEYISITQNGTKHGQNWSRHFETLKNAAGLGDDLTPYCLRHEFGTECARRGLDIRVTMRLMGHATIAMTAEIYTNLEQADILQATAILDSSDDVDVATHVAPEAATR
jgi:integrase